MNMDREIKLPLRNVIAYLVSIVSVLVSVSIGFATYQERFHHVVETIEKQQEVNEDLKKAIVSLQLDVARLQVEIKKNTEALTNARSR